MSFFDQTLIVKLLLAICIGGLIGVERELRSEAAGFRTLMLICVGATLFTIFSQVLGEKTSPDRIASNVVVGIGFLGAGVIFRGDGRVNGITTAASIWVTAALGVGIGSGYYIASVYGGLLVFTILWVFSSFDHYLDRLNKVRDYKIVYPYEDGQQHKYEDVFRKYGLKVVESTQSKTGNMIKGTWTVRGKESKHKAFIAYVLTDNTINEFDF